MGSDRVFGVFKLATWSGMKAKLEEMEANCSDPEALFLDFGLMNPKAKFRAMIFNRQIGVIAKSKIVAKVLIFLLHCVIDDYSGEEASNEMLPYPDLYPDLINLAPDLDVILWIKNAMSPGMIARVPIDPTLNGEIWNITSNGKMWDMKNNLSNIQSVSKGVSDSIGYNISQVFAKLQQKQWV